MTRAKILALLTLAAVLTVVSTSAVEWSEPETWLELHTSGGGYAIRASDPERAGRLEASYRQTAIEPIFDRLAREADVIVFYVQSGAKNLMAEHPLPVDAEWRGSDPLQCARSFADAAGLALRVVQPGVWLVGPSADIDRSALVAFTFPLTSSSQPRLDPDQERALLRDLPVRLWTAKSTHDEPDMRWVGIGYYRHPVEADTVMVLATEGTDASDPGIYGRLIKAQLTDGPAGPHAICLWTSPVIGKPAHRFAEDVTGDSVADVLVSGDIGGGPYRPDVLVSGADGEVLAEFGTEVVAVEQRSSGVRRLAVTYLSGASDNSKAAVLAFDPATKRLAELTPRSGNNAKTGGSSRPPGPWPIDRLRAEIDPTIPVKAYLLPGMRILEAVPEAVEVVESPAPNCWHLWIATGDRELKSIGHRRRSCPEVTVLIEYLGKDYLEAYAAAWGEPSRSLAPR